MRTQMYGSEFSTRLLPENVALPAGKAARPLTAQGLRRKRRSPDFISFLIFCSLLRQAYRRSVAAAAAAAVVSAAAVVGQAGEDDESNDYPDKALVVLKKVAKAVHNRDLLQYLGQAVVFPLADLNTILCGPSVLSDKECQLSTNFTTAPSLSDSNAASIILRSRRICACVTSCSSLPSIARVKLR